MNGPPHLNFTAVQKEMKAPVVLMPRCCAA